MFINIKFYNNKIINIYYSKYFANFLILIIFNYNSIDFLSLYNEKIKFFNNIRKMILIANIFLNSMRLLSNKNSIINFNRFYIYK